MEETIPTEFRLAQNCPNPFMGHTVIKYCIPDKMKIRLEIFDVNGIKLDTIVDDVKEAGTYKIDFNALRLEEGEYFYKLESENYFQTKKMKLIK